MLSVYNFSDRLMEHSIHFHVLKLNESFLVWIGDRSANMSSLAVSMTTPYDQIPSSASLLGEASDTPSTVLSQKLAKKTRKQVFVSYNLPTDQMLLPLVEKRLIEEMNTHPDKF
ncbi:proteasome assembly chaperone 4-like [Saccoglossus kowalevskii]|uniref:Proteasome assembly chaperone 4-like n=1 Tax=Saccoglossus kowalevskii TaxID=10224 RepID=A0ABM0H054_SACKO|nr:PREDICTED: proteasome assembly chaperone 4-like [Saccoglossus kowalevskii]